MHASPPPPFPQETRACFSSVQQPSHRQQLLLIGGGRRVDDVLESGQANRPFAVEDRALPFNIILVVERDGGGAGGSLLHGRRQLVVRVGRGLNPL